MTAPTRRIAIVHFTARREAGGVEQIVAAQAEAATALGHEVCLVAGDECVSSGPSYVRIPAMHPAHPEVRAALDRLHGAAPEAGHPLVRSIQRELAAACAGANQCWVHNALTVWLNPFLTVALCNLIEERRDIRWIAWCEDLSAASRHVAGSLPDTSGPVERVRDLVRWVTISQTRRAELARALHLPESIIRVVQPGLDVCAWLKIGPSARLLWDGLGLAGADVIVLAPSKALAHKGLHRALGVAAELRRICRHPKVLITAAPSPHEPDVSAEVLESLRCDIARRDLQTTVHLLADCSPQTADAGTIRDLMLLCDAVFLPSEEEGFGLPLWEAAAARVPVVCSDIPAFREVAGDAARFVGREAADEEVAACLVSVASSPRNRFRRDALSSSSAFRSALKDLLEEPYQPKV